MISKQAITLSLVLEGERALLKNMPGNMINGTSTSKLSGYDFYHTVLGSPKYVLAPMVDQSELAWRILSRRYGAQLAFTPMINAKMYIQSQGKKAQRDRFFDISNGEEGGPSDRPLIVQFCANNPDQLLASAKLVEDHCDAVDLNLGCPQEIARAGHYGSFLQDEWDLIYELINTLHVNLKIPVTAKFRVFPDVEKTVAYARMLESAGAQILTCHGRIREQRGQKTGLADWSKIRAVKDAVSVPVFANGNILYHSDIDRCLAETGADAVMSAEGQLYNPVLFTVVPPRPAFAFEKGFHLPHADLALEYLNIVQGLKTKTPLSAVKGHLFKLMRPALGYETDLREQLSKITGVNTLERYVEVVEEMKRRMKHCEKGAEGQTAKGLTMGSSGPFNSLPLWLAQPHFRPLIRSPGQESATSEGPPTAMTHSRVAMPHEEARDTKRLKLSTSLEDKS